jgi:hypothetical protein
MGSSWPIIDKNLIPANIRSWVKIQTVEWTYSVTTPITGWLGQSNMIYRAVISYNTAGITSNTVWVYDDGTNVYIFFAYNTRVPWVSSSSHILPFKLLKSTNVISAITRWNIVADNSDGFVASNCYIDWTTIHINSQTTFWDWWHQDFDMTTDTFGASASGAVTTWTLCPLAYTNNWVTFTEGTFLENTGHYYYRDFFLTLS